MASKLTRCSGNFSAVKRNFSVNQAPRSAAFVATKGGLSSKPVTSVPEDFPLPGNICSISQYQQQKLNRQQAQQWDAVFGGGKFAEKGPAELAEKFAKGAAPMEEPPVLTDWQTDQHLTAALNDVKAPSLECRANACPDFVKKDFADLFPSMGFAAVPMTVVTLAQNTRHDMTAWSPAMEAERDQLTLDFVSVAEKMCGALKEAGFWADFIDPSSGRPYMGPYTNATLFETDERYRHLGFRIEDLGCCKVIKHVLWGANTFVGALFTDAPLDSPPVNELLQAVNRCQPQE